MKLILAALAACSLLTTGNQAHAYPSSSNVSNTLVTSSGSGRKFNTSRTATSLGCTVQPDATCGSHTPSSCYFIKNFGYNPSGNACCYIEYICRDGQVADDLVATVEAKVANTELQDTFSPNAREAYWGYISTTARSSSAGRGNSQGALLDACLHYTNVDAYTVGTLSSWNACRSDCDSSKNGYCNNTGSNDGHSETNAACKDRCDCYVGTFNGYTCEGL